MAERLKGKRAIVTAAGAGIGRATALAFAREGAEVIATDIQVELLKQLSRDAQGDLTTQQLDVTDGRAIAAFAAQVSTPQILFNCAGYVHHGDLLSCSEEEWDRSFTLNVRSMYRMIKALLPRLIQQGGASIINMASVASSIKGASSRFVYGTTKAAVIGLTKSVATDYVTQGIRCNAICPGTVDSPSWRDRVSAANDPDQARRDFIARQPMGRVGTVEEIAALAIYLASDESAFTTGALHIVDGGWSM